VADAAITAAALDPCRRAAPKLGSTFWFRDEMVHTIQGGDLFIAAMGWAGLGWTGMFVSRQEGD